MTAQTTISHDQLQELDRLYKYRGRDEVIAFIEQHPALVPVLLEAPTKIAEYFPVQKLGLSLWLDPENDYFDAVEINIITTLAGKAALDAYRRYSYDWGPAASKRANHKFVIAMRDPALWSDV